MIEILRLSGRSLVPYLDAVAELRIRIFREYPYLYDGSKAYEADYLRVYADSPRSVVVLAVKDGEVVGASTGLPLEEADEAFRRPFVAAGIDPGRIFYFGESVLNPSERGRGIGHRFFDEREAHARALDFSITAFCAVQRSADHPLKPAGYRENDRFWMKRAYVRRDELATELEWKQIDSSSSGVTNRLVFWVKGADELNL